MRINVNFMQPGWVVVGVYNPAISHFIRDELVKGWDGIVSELIERQCLWTVVLERNPSQRILCCKCP